MLTLCIRYTLDPNKIAAFDTYVANEAPVIRENGGAIVGYFLPTDFAGPTNIGYGLIDFRSLDEYERYRAALAADPRHQHNVSVLAGSEAVACTERAFIARHAAG